MPCGVTVLVEVRHSHAAIPQWLINPGWVSEQRMVVYV